MKIAIASDHVGFNLKEKIKHLLESQGHDVLDFGTDQGSQCELLEFIYPAAIAVSKMKAVHGIFIDGTGYGSALIVNRISDLYAVACQDPFCAQLARSHANANVLCLGAEIIGPKLAVEIVNTWINTKFSEKAKHKQYVESVVRVSENHLKPLFLCDVAEYEHQVDKVVAELELRHHPQASGMA